MASQFLLRASSLTAAKLKWPTAALLRNFLVKRYGASPQKRLVPQPSGPTQSLSAVVKPNKIPQIVKDFQAHGWSFPTRKYWTTEDIVLQFDQDPVTQIWLDPHTGEVRCIGRQSWDAGPQLNYD